MFLWPDLSVLPLDSLSGEDGLLFFGGQLDVWVPLRDALQVQAILVSPVDRRDDQSVAGVVE